MKYLVLAAVGFLVLVCAFAQNTAVTCPAAESFRRTCHFACRGYRDGKKAEFVTCVRGSQYQFLAAIQNCNTFFAGVDTNNEPAAALHMCAMHTNQTALPLYDCMIGYFGGIAGCNLSGCAAKSLAADELDYDVLKCYQQVYNTFPAKFNCLG